MARNHVKQKRGKVRIVISDKKFNDNTYLMVFIFLTKPFFSLEFKKPVGSQKWIAKWILVNKNR